MFSVQGRKVENLTLPLKNHTKKKDVSSSTPAITGTAIFTAFLLAFLPARVNTQQTFDDTPYNILGHKDEMLV
jgi:hypothetical protein